MQRYRHAFPETFDICPFPYTFVPVAAMRQVLVVITPG
jgi:hypothetical protein